LARGALTARVESVAPAGSVAARRRRADGSRGAAWPWGRTARSTQGARKRAPSSATAARLRRAAALVRWLARIHFAPIRRCYAGTVSSAVFDSVR